VVAALLALQKTAEPDDELLRFVQLCRDAGASVHAAIRGRATANVFAEDRVKSSEQADRASTPRTTITTAHPFERPNAATVFVRDQSCASPFRPADGFGSA
jgi:hypothetical protein